VVLAARVFAALGDPTRLALIEALAERVPLSIAGLTRGSRLTRQAITKHLRVLRQVGLVRCVRHGRECRFRLRPAPLAEARRALDGIGTRWEDALLRLQTFPESGGD
jgi:DNA-binding transcriptional ArsR family regulator